MHNVQVVCHAAVFKTIIRGKLEKDIIYYTWLTHVVTAGKASLGNGQKIDTNRTEHAYTTPRAPRCPKV